LTELELRSGCGLPGEPNQWRQSLAKRSKHQTSQPLFSVGGLLIAQELKQLIEIADFTACL
jgi:hypothetical protein